MAYKDDDGRLNNFAKEPKLYSTQPLNTNEKPNYLILAIMTFLLVSGLIIVAVYASSVKVN